MASMRSFLLATVPFGVLGVGLTASAAPVTNDRLLNAASEPQNWLMVNQTYNNWRHSNLSQINRNNVGDLRVKFMTSIGGRQTMTMPSGTRGTEEAVPLVDDGYMYVPDTYNKTVKMDVRTGTRGEILWRFDPRIERARTSRGVALLDDNVYVTTHDVKIIAVNKNSGEIVWETNGTAPTDPVHKTPSPTTQGLSAAPTAIKGKILQGESTGGSVGTRSWIAAWDAKDGRFLWRFFTIPGPGEPGFETWADNNGAWRTGGGGVWGAPAYDPQTNVVIYGVGDPFPSFDPEWRPGDNLYTAGAVALDVESGKLKWFFQETPNESWDFDSPNSRMLYDLTINGVNKRVAGNRSRNGFFYSLDLNTGEFLRAEKYREDVNWTAGIDPKTGKPVEYIPGGKALQVYAGLATRRGSPPITSCPGFGGSPTYFPPSFDPKRNVAYVTSSTNCYSWEITRPFDPREDHVGVNFCCYNSKANSDAGAIFAADVRAGKVVAKATFPYYSTSGLLTTNGDVLFMGHRTGRFVAYDADTLAELWSFDVGTPIAAAPITYAVNGRQYVAVVAGGSLGGGDLARVLPGAQVVVFGL